MKQAIIKYLMSNEEDLYNISKYLYENPEESFCEHKASDYLIKILKDNNFKIKKNFLDMPTAFMAQFGEGHPKICYICEYDSVYKKGHMIGTNLVPSMTLGAALGLSKVIPEVGGSVIVIGCPGELLGGSKVVMSKQGVFEDIDVVFNVQPHTINANCNTSPAVLPINIKYSCDTSSDCTKHNPYSAFDACLFTLNSINLLAKGYSKDCSIDRISINGDLAPFIPPNNVDICFYIKAPDLNIAQEISEKVKTIALSLKELMNIDSKVFLHEVPYKNFVSNKTLSRIFSHNLKEVGTIDINEEINLTHGLSIGNVSNIVPTLEFLIKITDDESIEYASEEFKKATLCSFARNKVLDASKALALTGLDLINSETLLTESKLEIDKCNKKH